MSVLVADCPRCGASSMTFDVRAQVFRFQEHQWQNWYEVFSICRNCDKPTIFLIALKEYKTREAFYKSADAIVKYSDSLNPYFSIDRYVSLRDQVSVPAPEHLPAPIKAAFDEGAACFSIGCFNAAACMLRLCLDLASQPFLPDPTNTNVPQPNATQRRNLASRLAWLFANGLLSVELRELAKCVREDGNDGAHAGILKKEDAEDLLDFTSAFLDRLITQPQKLALAEARPPSGIAC
jgi:hypothetical protein